MYVGNSLYAALVFIMVSKEKIYQAIISISYLIINIGVFIFILFKTQKIYLKHKSSSCVANWWNFSQALEYRRH
jgi:hypothetical protein